MRSFDPSLLVLLILAALAAVISRPANSQEAPTNETTEEVRPVVYVSEATGLQIVFPTGWEGTRSVDETGLPGRATYRFEATASEVTGTAMIVERVTGLNPLVEERFRRGQVAFGYHGFRPTAALPDEAMLFGPGAGFVIAAGERTGRVYFAQRGRVYWAVHLSAPPAALAANPGLFDTLAKAIRLSDHQVEPPTETR